MDGCCMRDLKNYSYPAVRIKDKRFIFNKACNDILKKENYRVFATVNYIIFIPATNRGERTNKISGNVMTCKELIGESRVKQGIYKLYKFQDGAAIKRNELLLEC